VFRKNSGKGKSAKGRGRGTYLALYFGKKKETTHLRKKKNQKPGGRCKKNGGGWNVKLNSNRGKLILSGGGVSDKNPR